ncbi:diguanylate cyclase domain-containing protein [Halothiobacillus sp.]|uniref:sensor domain-containing protein n=1 Tax=Halothiobacillus sp. TaxID=1891311 RepID=UPI002AD4CE29|nr:diguanylate cyclase [Halothiobacillus sp.]
MTEPTPSFLAKIMDLMVDAVCAVDPQGRFVFISSACERIFGYTPDELIGRNMIELVYEEDRERTLAAASNIMAGQLQTHFENRYVRKDGRIVDIMWSARWSETDLIRLAVARDVTVIKRAERKQSAMYRISEAAHATEELPVLYAHIHQIIGELLPANNFGVALYNKSNDSLTFPYFVGENVYSPEFQPLDAHPHLARVIRTGQALLTTISPVPSDAEFGAKPNWLGVPLTAQDGIMGALVVRGHAHNVRYTEEDRDLLQFVSSQVTSAIRNKQTEARLRHMAGHDALTDLPNRALFHDRLDRALTYARRDGGHLALLYLDLNGFKQVNDTYGHDIGDRLLQAVANRLTDCLRESDTIARMGGDEFTVLLTKIHTPVGVARVIEKVHEVIGTPYEIGGHVLNISTSIGTSLYPMHGQSHEQLIDHADADMYAEKEGLRN